MNAEDYRDQQIERYVHNRMDEAERAAFALLMQSDPALKEEVDTLLELKSDYDKDLVEFAIAMRSVKDELTEKGFFEESNVRKLEPKRNFPLWWAIAASVVLIAGVYYFNVTKPVDYQQLAMNEARRGFLRSKAVDTPLDSIFNSGNYQGYINRGTTLRSDSLPMEDRIAVTVNIMRGYVLLNKADSARLFYDQLPDTMTEDCRVKYALAVALLSISKIDEAKAVLKAIDCYALESETKDLLKKL